MTFNEDWFSFACCTRLADLGKSIADVPGLVVEIGAWEGKSTCVLANAVKPRTVHSVDTWAGSPGEISGHLAKTRDVFSIWQANVHELTTGNVEPHRMGWRDYAPTITEPVALVFIDAEHTYREVFDNVQAFLPLIPSGGVVCGDDAGHPPVRRAVLDLLPPDDVMAQANMWWWVKP